MSDKITLTEDNLTELVSGIASKVSSKYATKSVATTSANGLMSATDKTKLNYTNIAYGTCTTAAATAAKEVTISGNSNWALSVGSIIVVKFTYTDTAANATINVNSTGAKSIWYSSAAFTAAGWGAGYAGRYTMFMYDGTYWVWMGQSLDAGNSGTVTSVALSATSPIAIDNTTAITTSGSRTISHATSGVTATTYGTNATTALTPAFGDTFTVDGFAVNATGHVTSASSHTVKIPSTTATTSAAGLMSAADKTKLGYTNIAYGTCATAAATAAKEITITGNSNWTLQVGSIVCAKFTYTNTASSPTINVNSTGAKSIWYDSAVYTSKYSIGGCANRYTMFMYDGTYWVWMGWSADFNNTYTPATLGQGYGTCSTAATETAKVVALTSYGLVVGGIVSVKFTYAVPANATMSINSRDAKAIYYRGAAIVAGVINAGDIATFIYNGSQYILLSVDSNAVSTPIDLTSLTVDLNDLTLSAAIAPMVARYYERTSGGANNITNIPVTGQPFVLEVKKIRWASTTDYITMQYFTSYTGIEYYRRCVAGTWSNWTKKVFTDTTSRIDVLSADPSSPSTGYMWITLS